MECRVIRGGIGWVSPDRRPRNAATAESVSMRVSRDGEDICNLLEAVASQ
jgi:hypothetical protein